MHYGWFLVPVVSAFTGWLASWILVKMLFQPKEPKKILGFTIQGIFPKRQRQVAEKLGKLVGAELFSFADPGKQVADPANFQKLMPLIEEHIDAFLRVKLPQKMPMIGMFIGDRTINELKAVFIEELETLFPVVMKSYMAGLHTMDLETMVTERLSQFSIDKMEQALRATMGRELKQVGLLAAGIGFLIGFLEVLIFIFA